MLQGPVEYGVGALPNSAEDHNVFEITMMNELVTSHNMSSVNLMKVAGEFVNPKVMRSHSKMPSLDLNEVLHMSED